MALKWIPLDGKKDPIPGKHYVVKNKGNFWDKMKLIQISLTEEGKAYEFSDYEGNRYLDCTYYMDITSNIEP